MKITGTHVNLRYVTVNDAEFIVNLRLKNGQYLSKIDPDPKKQIKWIKLYKNKEKEEKEFYFIINNASKKVGLIRIYDIDYNKNSFTFGSFIIDKDLCHKYTALESILLIFKYAFIKLNLEECYFDCRINNDIANNFYIRLGCKIIKEDSLNYYYKYTKDIFNKEFNNLYAIIS